MFTLNINTDCGNEAFTDNTEAEVLRILKDVIKKIQTGKEYGACMDINGNKVGEFSF